MRWFLRSKIHNATVTQARIDYEGSITIDEALLEKVGLRPGEKVLVADCNNGARVETYVIAGERGSGSVCMNGAAARLIHRGDQVIIMGFELSEEPVEARKVLVDENNDFVRYL
ncbi:MAG: aspartate 1-decarboxylase [Planctomycetota bacterium]